MNRHKTQIGKLLEQIKNATASKIPIVYIPTNQIEVINELIFGESYYGSLIPRLCYDREQMVTKFIEYKSISEGTKISDNYQILNSIKYTGELQNPTLFVSFVDDFKDVLSLKKYISDYYGYRLNCNLSQEKQRIIQRSVYIIVTPCELPIPANLSPYVRTIRIEPICDKEIENTIFQKLDEYSIPHEVILNKKELFNQMRVSFRGFSTLGIKQFMDQMIISQSIDFEEVTESEVLGAINELKKQQLSSISGLKWEKSNSVTAIGLDKVSSWLKQHSILFRDPKHALHQHIDIPGAILLTGIPGSGKSLMAKTAARDLKMPLISLDMGAIRDKYQGESEHNMISALQKAEQMSPCVLWVDEIEKAFGSSSNSNDGVGQRLFGKFLTWMQEKNSSCFVFATSNDVTKLPPELFRSERFSKKYFTFMPMVKECAQIFIGVIAKQNTDYQNELLTYGKAERKGMPKELFASTLLSERIWIDILNGCCCDNEEDSSLVKYEEKDNYVTYKWKKDTKPSNKLLTGADISSIIKEAKFQVNPKLESSSNDVIYDHSSFVNAVKDVIKTFKPYGATNLRDIAKCFYLLYQNQFESASENNIIDFDHFTEDDLVYTPKFISHERYDKILYNTVVGAINKYLPLLKAEK